MKLRKIPSLPVTIFRGNTGQAAASDAPRNATLGIARGACPPFAMCWSPSPLAQFGGSGDENKANAVGTGGPEGNGSSPTAVATERNPGILGTPSDASPYLVEWFRGTGTSSGAENWGGGGWR